MSLPSVQASIALAGISTAGQSHLRCGTPCQDASAWEVLPGGGGVVAVADGAGSSALSDLGAQKAVDTVLRTIHTLLSDDLRPTASDMEAAIELAIEEARIEIRKAAVREDATDDDFSTTIQVAVAYPGRIAFAQLGDGACVLRDATSDSYDLVFPPQEGEHAGETCFLPRHPSQEWPLLLKTLEAEWACFALLTDGTGNVAVDRTSLAPVSGFFGPLEKLICEAGPKTATRWLEQELQSGPTAERVHDDRTLVLAVYRECGS